LKGIKQVTIVIDKEKFIIEQNEFWYFRFLLIDISDYYKIKDNQGKAILLKIPGTKIFKRINYSIFRQVIKQVDDLIATYKRELIIL
tara:strand:+ start:153 stop:413 length:261 start_codon:yes stop_codon:yes gene_type:complete